MLAAATARGDEGRFAATAMAALSTATVAAPPAALTLPRERAGKGGWVRTRLRKAGDVDRLLGDEFEEGRGAFASLLDAAADRRDDLLGLGDALAIAAERAGEIGVITADVGRAIFLGRDRHDLQLDRHREIVKEDRQDREALAHRGLEIHAGKADRGVAPHVDAELVRRRQLRTHRDAEPIAELRGLAPAD